MKQITSACMTVFVRGRVMRYKKGDVIIRTGDEPSGVYCITSGWVQVVAVSQTGEPNILFTIYEGDIFPLSWTATGKFQNVTFSALGDTTAYRISRNSFLEAMQSNPEFVTDILHNFASQHQRLSDEQENLHFHSAGQRVAYRILVLAKQFSRPSQRGVFIKYPVTNEYIARSSNMTRETASREMTKLCQKRLITVHRGHIFITDIQELSREATSSNAKYLQLLS